jgi:CubicO group peptidase (beta-lactamase class C family)
MDMLGFVARFLAYGVACLLLFGPRAARAADRFADMDPYIREAMKKWEVPGLAIAVVKDGEMVIARGYGVCEFGKDRKVTKDTVFPIASCNKSFTAACVAMLIEEGKLGWDDPVAKHLPGFELSDPYRTKHVTVRDLLCHRIGLPGPNYCPTGIRRFCDGSNTSNRLPTFARGSRTVTRCTSWPARSWRRFRANHGTNSSPSGFSSLST